MSKKNIFLLAAGYVAGGIIASLYNKKKPLELKKDLKKSKLNGEGEFKVILDNFVETHSNLLNDLKSHLMTDKNKELFNEKKQELLNILDDYKKQGIELSKELKVKGKDFLFEASENLEKLYKDKKQEIEQLKDITPEKIKSFGEDLGKSFKKIKKNKLSKK